MCPHLESCPDPSRGDGFFTAVQPSKSPSISYLKSCFLNIGLHLLWSPSRSGLCSGPPLSVPLPTPPRPVLPTASNRRYLLDKPQRIQERWAGVTETRLRWMEARDWTVVIARQGLSGLSRARLCWVLGGGGLSKKVCAGVSALRVHQECVIF